MNQWVNERFLTQALVPFPSPDGVDPSEGQPQGLLSQPPQKGTGRLGEYFWWKAWDLLPGSGMGWRGAPTLPVAQEANVILQVFPELPQVETPGSLTHFHLFYKNKIGTIEIIHTPNYSVVL